LIDKKKYLHQSNLNQALTIEQGIKMYQLFIFFCFIIFLLFT